MIGTAFLRLHIPFMISFETKFLHFFAHVPNRVRILVQNFVKKCKIFALYAFGE